MSSSKRYTFTLTLRSVALFLGLAASSASAQELCIDVNTPATESFEARITGANDNFYTLALQPLTLSQQEWPATGTLALRPSAAAPTRLVAGWTVHHPNGHIAYYCSQVFAPFPNSNGRKTSILGGFTPPVPNSGSCRFYTCPP